MVHRVALGVVLRAGVSVFNTNLKYDKTSSRFNHLGLWDICNLNILSHPSTCHKKFGAGVP